MPLTVQQLAQTLAETGIMTLEELRSIQETLPTKAQGAGPDTADALALAHELVRRNKLTEYQARLLHGNAGKGVVMGSYLILDEIGAGGMGRVYKAQHRRMKRVVALKVLSPSATLTEDSIRRFQREVEAAAKLNHPNIVTAYDADEQDGMHYLVMEYVDGTSLAAAASSGNKIPVATAVNYILQTAHGLSYAHQQGIVHRDVKPGNLLLDSNGTIKILDMGLARIEQSPGALDEADAQKLTQAGQIMGTIDFMSPEQAEDTRQADARADIYSLGCTLYFLLTGEVPYPGDTLMRKLLAHRSHPIPTLLDKRPNVPKYLDGIFRRMVAKLPAQRYQTMAEVIMRLETFQNLELQSGSRSGILKHGLGSGIGSRGEYTASTNPPASAPLSDSHVLSSAEREGSTQADSPHDEEYMLQEDADKLKASRSTLSQKPVEPGSIRVRCTCGRQFNARPEMLGRKVKCPQCGGAMTIARQSPAPPTTPASNLQTAAAEPQKIDVVCKCGVRFAASAKLAGKTVKCSKCGAALKIPAAPSVQPPSAERIEVVCTCGRPLKANAQLAGKTVKCPACSAAIKIPRPG